MSIRLGLAAAAVGVVAAASTGCGSSTGGAGAVASDGASSGVSSVSPTSNAAPADALTAIVRAQDAAIYAYTVAGARVAARGRARTDLVSHRVERDSAAATLAAAAAGNPIEPSPAYSLTPDPQTPAQARSVLAGVEMSLVPLYLTWAQVLTGPDRARALATARACADRARSWGGTPATVPAQ